MQPLVHAAGVSQTPPVTQLLMFALAPTHSLAPTWQVSHLLFEQSAPSAQAAAGFHVPCGEQDW